MMSSAAGLYISVINDVVGSIRDAFLDEGIDENVLQELKQLWTAKLEASKTVDTLPVARGAQQEAALESKAAARAKSSASTASTSRGHARGGNVAAPTVIAGSSTAAAGSSVPPAGGSSAGNPQLVITDPNRLVPVQITIPAQPGNPASNPRSLTVNVPAHALQPSSATSPLLQSVLTQAITQALTLPESHAAVFLQNQINHTFKLN